VRSYTPTKCLKGRSRTAGGLGQGRGLADGFVSPSGRWASDFVAFRIDPENAVMLRKSTVLDRKTGKLRRAPS
jgi:hypothetical protein